MPVLGACVTMEWLEQGPGEECRHVRCMYPCIYLFSVAHHYLAGRGKMGAVQAGISKFPLLLDNRTGCRVNMGNEGLRARASPLLTF